MIEANTTEAVKRRLCKKTAGASHPNSPVKSEWRAWKKAKGRCYNKTDSKWSYYGARGTQMCDLWRYDFSIFIHDMGPKPTEDHSLDRINNHGHYSCGHCDHCDRMGWTANGRWATRQEQNRNNSQNVWIEAFGKKQLLVDWGIEKNLSPDVIRNRIKKGMHPEDALTRPLQSGRPLKILPPDYVMPPEVAQSILK